MSSENRHYCLFSCYATESRRPGPDLFDASAAPGSLCFTVFRRRDPIASGSMKGMIDDDPRRQDRPGRGWLGFPGGSGDAVASGDASPRVTPSLWPRIGRHGRRCGRAGRGAAGDMTVAEKAGQLTQYFYFACRRPSIGGDRGEAADRPRPAAGDGRGGAGRRRRRVAAVRHRPGRDQPAAAASDRGQPARHPGAVRLRRDPRAAHDLPGADRDGGLLGPGRRSSAARRSPRARRAPSASTGRSRRWSTSPATRAGAGSSRAPARTRTSARPSRAAQVRGFQGDELGAPGADHRRAQALRRLRRRARRPRLRRGQPLRLRAVERLPAAVPGGGRGRRRQHHDRVHGPQRHPGDRQPLAVHRGAARARGASTASSSATPTPSATW